MINKKYMYYLENEIFEISENHQFQLLLNNLSSELRKENQEIGVLERSYIYLGKSIFSQVVIKNEHVKPIDYRPLSAMSRSGFQKNWLSSSFKYKTTKNYIEDTQDGFIFDLSNLNLDTLLVPNVLHHCRDFESVIKILISSMPNLSRICIFDSYIREQHQEPDDYCRHTIFSLSYLMSKTGFNLISREEIGNIFDGILYLLNQSKQLLNTYSELAAIKDLSEKLTPELKKYNKSAEYRPLKRPYASYASAYYAIYER